MSYPALIRAILPVASEHERQALAIACEPKAANDWDGVVTPERAKATVAWFSLACDLSLFAPRDSTPLRDEQRYRRPDEFAPQPDQWESLIEDQANWVKTQLNTVADPLDDWALIRSTLALRWILRMRRNPVPVRYLKFRDGADSADEVNKAWASLSSGSASPGSEQYVNGVLAVCAWGRGFGEFAFSDGRTFVPPSVQLPDNLRFAIEVCLFPLGTKSRRDQPVWDDFGCEWPYLEPPKELPERLNAEVVAAKWHSKPERCEAAKNVLIEIERYGWANAVGTLIRSQPKPRVELPFIGEMKEICGHLQNTKINDPGSGKARQVFNIVLFGFSMTGKTTLLGNLFNHWLPNQWPARWETYELNKTWRDWSTSPDLALRQTNMPMQVIVPLDNDSGPAIRFLDVPGEWYRDASNAAFLKCVLQLAHAVLVVRPLSLEISRISPQKEALGAFLEDWSPVPTGRAFSPALIYCINQADKVEGWTPRHPVLLADSWETGVANDLDAIEILAHRRDFMKTITGSAIKKYLEIVLDEVGSYQRLATANGGFGVALLGGDGENKLTQWGNRAKLTGITELAEGIETTLKSRGPLLTDEWVRAAWARDKDSSMSLANPISAVGALWRAVWHVAAGRVKEI